jgi:hypothetical protein
MNSEEIYSYRDTKAHKEYNKHKRIVLHSLPFVIAAFTFTCVRIAVNKPGIVEKYYSTGLYPVIARLISSVSRLIPFSIWDIFWILTVIVVLAGLVLVIIRRLTILKYLLRAAQYVAILYTLFYITWGFNYFRPPIESRAGWEKVKPGDELFRTVLDSLIKGANSNYISIDESQYAIIDDLVEKSYRQNKDGLGISYPNGSRRPKKMVLSSLFAKSNVSGYFGPFFNEVHLNGLLFPIDYPYVLAHEKAHQFAITSEAEANLAAFVVCSTSEDKRLRYSAAINMLLYFLNDATGLADYHDYVKKIDSLVISDIRERAKYYDTFQNETLEKIQRKANDVYLKSNHIKKGVRNYNQVVALVILWQQNKKRLSN